MNAFLELMGVALAALLSENLVLVTCVGTGSRVRSLLQPADALRTGGCLTAVMLLTASEPQRVAQTDLACEAGERSLADQRSAQTGQLPLRTVRKLLIKMRCNHHT